MSKNEQIQCFDPEMYLLASNLEIFKFEIWNFSATIVEYTGLKNLGKNLER